MIAMNNVLGIAEELGLDALIQYVDGNVEKYKKIRKNYGKAKSTVMSRILKGEKE